MVSKNRIKIMIFSRFHAFLAYFVASLDLGQRVTYIHLPLYVCIYINVYICHFSKQGVPESVGASAFFMHAFEMTCKGPFFSAS